ncbi:MAG TPA: transcriptional regulator [Bacteroidetes bacterium]|nr:transcriptional regulator [Bacteroidota bacterium]
MIAILTGDIINSRKDKHGLWRNYLKEVLSFYGDEPQKWEIFRGDSFQLEVDVDESLRAALLIKASIKQVKGIDVRIAIGIGDKDFTSKRITESTGSAFINSGECFDKLKKYSLAVKTSSSEFDEEVNLYITLALLTINNWLPVTSKIVKTTMINSNLNQKDVAQLLNKSESTISEGLKRAGYEEIMKMEKRYRKLVSKYFSH